MERILESIRQERRVQDEKWGGPDHDDRHGPGEWIDYIVEHTEKAAAQLGEDQNINGGQNFLNSEARKQYRQRLREVAALAVAALEADDRNAIKKGAAA